MARGNNLRSFHIERHRISDTACKGMGVDPITLDTTTMGIADALPIYQADDEGNPFTSDTKDEQISSPPTFISMQTESTLNSRFLLCNKSTNCGTRKISANTVLEAKTASTPNLLGNQLSTTPRYSVCNPYFPGTMSLISTSQFPPRVLKKSVRPRSV